MIKPSAGGGAGGAGGRSLSAGRTPPPAGPDEEQQLLLVSPDEHRLEKAEARGRPSSSRLATKSRLPSVSGFCDPRPGAQQSSLARRQQRRPLSPKH